jgi:cytoskeletal protein CcmA (bactofilin family)
MFRAEQKSGNKNQPQKDQGVTILTAGCHFTGKLYCRGATRIGGTIEGQVIAEGLLVVEEEALIKGEITAEDIVIHGRIEGMVEGKRRVEICSTAQVTADINAVSLVVHEGGQFNGRSTMKRSTTAEQGHDLRKMNANKKIEKVEKRNEPTIDAAARIQDINLGPVTV